jgi:tetratricopeptide (TPR) repeat protein
MHCRFKALPILTWLATFCLAGTGAEPLRADTDAQSGSTVTALESAAEWLHLGRPREALEALKPVEAVEPDNPWMWFYRGTAHAQLSDPYEAMECYDHALDVLVSLNDPDPELAAKIREQRQRARRQVFTMSISVGYAYDTNVPYLGQGIVGVQGFVGVTTAQKDYKAALSTAVEYAPVATAEQTLAFGLRTGDTWHHSIGEFNYQDYGGTALYSRRFGRNVEASLRYDYDMTFLGNDSFLQSHLAAPGLDYIWDRADRPFRLNRTHVYYQFQALDFFYETTPAFDRDGVTHGVGVDQTFQWEPIDQWVWDLRLGYLFSSIHTAGTEFDLRQHDFFFNVGVPLVNPARPTEYLLIKDLPLTFQFGVQFEIGDYLNPSLLDSTGQRRDDLITIYTWALSQKLLEHPDLGDMTLQGLIQFTDAYSNVVFRNPANGTPAEPYSYEKTIYGLQLVWQW